MPETELLQTSLLRLLISLKQDLLTSVSDMSSESENNLLRTVIHFPKENTRHSNAIINLEHATGGEWCRLEFLFDGEQFLLKDMVSSARFYDKGYDALIKEELINRPEGLSKFLNRCFEPFRFSELESDCKNLSDYLCDGRYKVGLTEPVQTPFLILHTCCSRISSS